jgi:hypothetical protein
MPGNKDDAYTWLSDSSHDKRLLDAWYFNDYPDSLLKPDVQRALIKLLSEEDQSIAIKMVVCEVLAQVPSCYEIIAPYMVQFLESADGEVVRSVTYSACIAGGAILGKKISSMLGDQTYQHPSCRRIVISELLRLQSFRKNDSIRKNAEAFLEQAKTQGTAVISLINDVSQNGVFPT